MTDQASRVTSDIDNARTVETFLYALQDEDFDTVDSTFADTIVWQNEVKIHRMAADGDTVLTERTDAIVIGPLRLQFWVCGVFEVHAGRITLWRDYFDLLDIAKGTLRGLAGTVFRSLRPTL